MPGANYKNREMRPIVWPGRDRYEDEREGQSKCTCSVCGQVFYADIPRKVCSVRCARK